MIKRFNQLDSNFNQNFTKFLNQHQANNENANRLYEQVHQIISEVKTKGLNALLELTEKYDHWQPKCLNDLIFTQADFKTAYLSLDKKEKKALEAAKERIIDFHQAQKIEEFNQSDQYGNQVGQMIRALERVGVYVPGGSAAYPSSVLMNALPARVAGVDEIVMAVPTPKGRVNQMVLAAAHLADISIGYRIGGAQAIAALSYGINDLTNQNSIQKVDKIVGPGNQYVAEAKRQVFGQVGIDMIAGPSELTIVCDDSADWRWVCLDAFAQAEHDELAQVIVISTSADFLACLEKEINLQIKKQPRKEMIKKSLINKGAFIQVATLDDAIKLVNQIAPEHLELAFNNANDYLDKIKNAGAVFVGHYSAEVFGDYCAGPSHVLPTSASARFSSALSVYDFIKRISVIECSKKGAMHLANIALPIAKKEGLFAHHDSASIRLKKRH